MMGGSVSLTREVCNILVILMVNSTGDSNSQQPHEGLQLAGLLFAHMDPFLVGELEDIPSAPPR